MNALARPSEAATGIAGARAALAARPDGVLEAIAREHGVSTLDVLRLIPQDQRVEVPGARFEAIWKTMTGWGEILFIVHTQSIVLEVEGVLVDGSVAHGWFNVDGDSPIGGHIKASDCALIVFVDRPFHGRRSCSVQFFDKHGEAMFKVFVRRDASRELIAPQLKAFETLRSAA